MEGVFGNGRKVRFVAKLESKIKLYQRRKLEASGIKFDLAYRIRDGQVVLDVGRLYASEQIQVHAIQ